MWKKDKFFCKVEKNLSFLFIIHLKETVGGRFYK